ncbi:MAG: UDP-4-amino-4,6-dideoxy-N-acetyl-beta-L-altrosamine transaminase [Rickettsiales bacterium]|jgi:UDP-4-amino-4,6-dideoxy-N-acetyl-beta-L-altrosamine transaminase|nr:UDP-4-amino-4,6-dideoxy-N-acetyl-beta-L-altrosamine transaminase [Rickettsiales bacterium]
MSFIPYGRQNITDDDIAAVVKCLKSDFITQGPAVTEFENKLANFCGAKYALSASNATACLYLAYRALGLALGDVLWTVSTSFVATSNMALQLGASVEFIDINPDDFLLDVDLLEHKLQIAKVENKLPKIVVPVHLTGLSCDMKRISELSKKYGFKIVEDASHAIGASYLGSKVGSCEFSDACVFSFHPVKIITTGEGGMVTTNSQELLDNMSLNRSHGVTRDADLLQNEVPGEWYYEQLDLGFNFRLTDIQAALGSSQMDRLKDNINTRNVLALHYHELLKDLPVKLQKQYDDIISSYHLFVILCENYEQKKTLFSYLRESGIGVNVHYIPIHTQPYYQKLGFKKGDFPVSEDYYERVISIPMFYGLKPEEQEYVVNKISDKLF